MQRGAGADVATAASVGLGVMVGDLYVAADEFAKRSVPGWHKAAQRSVGNWMRKSASRPIKNDHKIAADMKG
jgi:hypothetical protein